MTEGAGSEQSQGRLRLTFSAGAEAGAAVCYIAAIWDLNGTEMLTMRLPRELVDQVVLSHADIAVELTLSGDVYADADLPDHRGLGHVAIDRLVVRAIEPPMLQDEPNAGALLRELKQKLTAAVDAVEAVLSTIDKG